jgi:hypothetical protein
LQELRIALQKGQERMTEKTPIMERILTALRSPGAMMFALVLALIAQGEHTAQVFAYFSHPTGQSAQPLAYAFAAAVEVAVLLFVLKGHKYISYGFAVATFATNMVYYAIGGIDLQGPAIAPVLLLSALLPGVIVGYSHTIAETPAAEPHTPAADTPRPARQKAAGRSESAAPSVDATTITTAPHSDPPEGTAQAPDAAPTAKSKRAANPNRERALQMQSEGFNTAEIAKLLNEKQSTVASWLYRGAQRNGAMKEAQQ